MKCVIAFCHEGLPLSTRGAFELCTCEGQAAGIHLVIAGLLHDHTYKCEKAALNDPIGLSLDLQGRDAALQIKYACGDENRKRKIEKWQVPHGDSVALKTVETVKIIMWRC